MSNSWTRNDQTLWQAQVRIATYPPPKKEVQWKGGSTEINSQISLTNKIIGIASFLPWISLFPFVWLCFCYQCFSTSSLLFGSGIQMLCFSLVPLFSPLLHSHASPCLVLLHKTFDSADLQQSKFWVLPLKSLSSTECGGHQNRSLTATKGCSACDTEYISFFSPFVSSPSPSHARWLQTWGRASKRTAVYAWPSTTARKRTRTALTVWESPVCFPLLQGVPVWLQVCGVSALAKGRCFSSSLHNYLSFFQLCTHYNISHLLLSPLLLPHFIVAFIRGPREYYVALHHI